MVPAGDGTHVKNDPKAPGAGVRPKAVALMSGGLDSTLAVRMLLDRGVEVHGVNFRTPFCNCNRAGRPCEAVHQGHRMGVPVEVIPLGEAYLDVVRNPKFGYGRAMNPCLDCRILMLKRADAHARSIGADFLVTGDVVGQRPMSQRREAMATIEREAGVTGRVLRPLTAKRLPVTAAEREGLVDREALAAIAGRSRREQIDRARGLGLVDTPCASGGCLLTEPGYARKLRDLLDRDPQPSPGAIQLLRIGRHFRLSADAKGVVGRNEEENRLLDRRRDAWRLRPSEVPGPTALVLGRPTAGDLLTAAGIVARYSDGGDGATVAVQGRGPDGWERRWETTPPAPDVLERLRI